MNAEPLSSPWMDKLLPFAFSMWHATLKNKSVDYLQSRTQALAPVISGQSDALMYGSVQKGQAGNVFNCLAEGIAALTLLTNSPVPFAANVFLPDGTVLRFKTEEEANNYVWPKNMSVLPPKQN